MKGKVMMRMVQVLKVVTVRPPEPRVIELHLMGGIGVGSEELAAALAEGMPALAAHNERAAQVLRWHYGLDGNTLCSVDEIRQRFGNISATSVRRVHDAGFRFLRQYYVRAAERVSSGGVLRLRVPCFFRLKRFLDHLDDTPQRSRVRVAVRMQRAVFGHTGATDTMSDLLVYWSERSRKEMKKKLGRKTFAVLEAILASVSITPQWSTTLPQKTHKRPRLRLVKTNKVA